MKIAITGYKGMVGSEILRQRPEYDAFKCDITNPIKVRSEIERIKPDIIIHCAALTDVHECEKDKKKAFAVNVRGTGNIAEWCKRGHFIYLSTDHVFDGNRYWAYSEKHKPHPINDYGMTKFMGEAVANFASNPVIVRSSKLFDYEMVKDDLECLGSGMEVDFTDRIYRTFVHVEHFVEGLLSLVDKIVDKEVVIDKKSNIINISGKDRYTYYMFWFLLAREFGIPLERVIKRTKTLEQMGIETDPRPFRCGLNTKKAERMGIPIYSANDGIELMKERIDGR
jgi:dTDP-4-dehydrorhamnose reductase